MESSKIACASKSSLVHEFTPLARKIAWTFYRRRVVPLQCTNQLLHLERSDVYAEAMSWLVYAASEYDSKRGPFSSFAATIVRRHMNDFFDRATNREAPGLFLRDELMHVGGDYGSETGESLFETLESQQQESALLAIEQLETFRQYFNDLTVEEQYLVRLRLGNPDLSQQKCAQALIARFGGYYDQGKVSSMLKNMLRAYRCMAVDELRSAA